MNIFVWKWSKITAQKKGFFCCWFCLGPPSYGIGATIRIGRGMLCLPYAGFMWYVLKLLVDFSVFIRENHDFLLYPLLWSSIIIAKIKKILILSKKYWKNLLKVRKYTPHNVVILFNLSIIQAHLDWNYVQNNIFKIIDLFPHYKNHDLPLKSLKIRGLCNLLS